MPSGKRDARLESYRRKRAADRTPEPFGGEPAAPRPRLFVVQQHAARHEHWDFRLEWRGVLWSWAVPRGPSLDPSVKRLAVQVEDHPVEYADFEGVIPEGNYGAGAVICWDRGRWTPLEDPDDGIERGKLLFDLAGHKLGGRWTLVRTGGRKSTGKEWLLIKKPDGAARAGEPPAAFDQSVLSGLTLAERRDGHDRVQRTRRALKRLGAPEREVDAAKLRPMLAESREGPFSKPGWIFEVKYDGYRAIARAGADEDAARLYSRNGHDLTPGYPEVAQSLAALPGRLVLDGELVVTDREGRPDFARLQRRAQLRRPREILRASLEEPVTFFVFDLPACDGYDLRALPLERRKALLAERLPAYGPLRYADHFVERGEEVYAEIERRGVEGMIAKQADAPYRSGRSARWLKIRALRTDDFVVVGATPPRGRRTGFGALHLAAYDEGGDLVYAGRVGSGFSERDLDDLGARLEALRRDDAPCTGRLPTARSTRWLAPRLVVEVRYAELTREGLLRQPVFLRWRDDKDPAECRRPRAHDARREDPAAVPVIEGAATEPREVAFSNLDKVFWPKDGFTKGDLIDYHRAIAPWLLPYLKDRPLVLTRYPDGIEGKSFFQKDAPAWTPDWLRTERMWSEHGGREIRYFVCDDLESLLYVVNLGTIPLHVWSSRIATLQHPDWCILDLDPKQAPLQDVVTVARRLHRLCDELELPNFVKTSGSSGLHVLIPLAGGLTYAQSRTLAELLARVVADELPEIATLARRLAARKGRVYVDTLQNGHGRLLAAPFCVRALPGAPVSMPLRWSEVTKRLDLGRYTIRSAPRRMARLGEDPLRPVLDTTADLAACLARLSRRMNT